MVILAALALSACSSPAPSADLSGRVVDPPFTVSTQALIDTSGAGYSLSADTGKRLTLVFFGYTHCPEICGTVLSNLASALTRLDEADRAEVQVVFVTTDPERDTTEVLRDYLDRYDPNFIGLTGELGDIEQVAASVAVGMGDKLPSGGYEVDAHTTQTTGIDIADEAPIYWSQETSSAEFAQDIHTLLGED